MTSEACWVSGLLILQPNDEALERWMASVQEKTAPPTEQCIMEKPQCSTVYMWTGQLGVNRKFLWKTQKTNVPWKKERKMVLITLSLVLKIKFYASLCTFITHSALLREETFYGIIVWRANPLLQSSLLLLVPAPHSWPISLLLSCL